MKNDWLKLVQKILALILLLILFLIIGSGVGEDQGWRLLFIAVFGSPVLAVVSLSIVIGSIIRIKRLTKIDRLYFIISACTLLVSLWYCWRLFIGK